jgi:hypothetical protein
MRDASGGAEGRCKVSHLRLVEYRPHRTRCAGQHPRCQCCRNIVERHRKYARPLAYDETPQYLAAAEEHDKALREAEAPVEITLELNDGMIICKYASDTGEIIELYDWHGNDVSYRWERAALERIAEAMAEKASQS